MKHNRPIGQRLPQPPIKTSLMELLEELSNITKDDALIVASVKDIFSSYRVRLGPTLAPVRLVGEDARRELRRNHSGPRSSAWA